MKRYSVFSKVAQDWLISEGKFFLNLSGRLDVDGLYRDSESYLNYGVRLSGLLRISANDDVVNMDEISVDSVDGRDVDNVYVEDVNPDEIYVGKKFWYSADNFINAPGLIYKGNFPKLTVRNNDVIVSMMNFLSMGVGNVFVCLKSLSDNYVSFKDQISGSSDLRKALYSYFKNPLFLEDILEVNNIIRDIEGGVVNRDTVALFSRVLDLYVKRQNVFIKRRVELEKLINDRVPELATFENLKTELLNVSNENFEVYLEVYEDATKLLKSYGADSSLIQKVFSSGLSFFRKHLFESPKEFVGVFKYSNDINLISIPVNIEKLKVLPENLWAEFLDSDAERLSVQSIKLYSVLMPDIFEDCIKNSRFGAFDKIKLGNVTYSNLQQLYVVYKMSGKDALYNLRVLEDIVSKNPISFELHNDLKYLNPDFISSRFETVDEVKSRMIYDSFKKAYDSELKKMLGEKKYSSYISSHDFAFLDFVPYYLKINKDSDTRGVFGKAINLVNNIFPYVGEKILDHSFETLDNYDYTTKKDPELLSIPEIRHVEVFNLYNDNPLFKSLKFSDWLEFNDKVFHGEYGSDIEAAKRKINFIRSMKISGLILYMFGDDPKIYKDGDILGKVSSIVGNVKDSKSAEYYKNLILKDYIGSKDVLNNYTEGFDLNRYSPVELSLSKSMGEREKDNIVKIRKSISRSKNYAGISWGSPEYEKIYAMINKEWEARGRDPKLLTELFDASVFAKDNVVPLLCGYVNAATGITDFSGVGFFAKISQIETSLSNNLNALSQRYDQLFKSLKLVREQIINIGGFNVLFSEDPDVLVRVLRIRDEDIENFKEELSSKKMIKGAYFDSAIRVDYNLLKSKYIVYGLKLFFEEYPEAKESIKAGINIRYNEFNFDNNIKILGERLLNDSDNFIPEVYGVKLSFSNNIKLPENDYQQNLKNYEENISSAGKIAAIFNLDSYRILDKFSFKICQQKGLPTKGFKYIPDLALKAEIIHDLGNLLPSNIKNLKFDGLADYYIKYLGMDDKNLKYVAEAWNNEISLLDEDMNFFEKGLVKEFAKEQDPIKLSQLIKRSNAKELFESLQPKSTKFGLQFIDNFNAPESSEANSANYKILYRGCEDIYLRGLRVPMPSWSSFTSQNGDMTLKFLQREDPRGMMLGKITECCQEPTSWAASCAYDGHLNPLAAFAVFEIGNEIIYESYVWSDEEGNVCFDSIEASKRSYKLDSDKIILAKNLLLEFKESIDGQCTVGNNFFGFMKPAEALKNPTETHEEDDVKALLIKFSPNGENFYIGDSRNQYKVV